MKLSLLFVTFFHPGIGYALHPQLPPSRRLNLSKSFSGNPINKRRATKKLIQHVLYYQIVTTLFDIDCMYHNTP